MEQNLKIEAKLSLRAKLGECMDIIKDLRREYHKLHGEYGQPAESCPDPLRRDARRAIDEGDS